VSSSNEMPMMDANCLVRTIAAPVDRRSIAPAVTTCPCGAGRHFGFMQPTCPGCAAVSRR
jgi:hypothetical protein